MRNNKVKETQPLPGFMSVLEHGSQNFEKKTQWELSPLAIHNHSMHDRVVIFLRNYSLIYTAVSCVEWFLFESLLQLAHQNDDFRLKIKLSALATSACTIHWLHRPRRAPKCILHVCIIVQDTGHMVGQAMIFNHICTLYKIDVLMTLVAVYKAVCLPVSLHVYFMIRSCIFLFKVTFRANQWRLESQGSTSRNS